MRHITELLTLWPSDADFARDLGIPYPTASAWKQRCSIPVGYWRAIIQAARLRGHPEITADFLVRLHAREETDGVGGLAAYRADIGSEAQTRETATGHFSRHKHARQNNFQTAEQIEDHIRGLREEWSDR
jgi:hypothetical protein